MLHGTVKGVLDLGLGRCVKGEMCKLGQDLAEITALGVLRKSKGPLPHQAPVWRGGPHRVSLKGVNGASAQTLLPLLSSCALREPRCLAGLC